VAGFLHGIARQVALNALRASGRRRRREAAPRPVPNAVADPLDELTARELLLVLDEEVQRLPDDYRLPVILCCLEGLSLEEAAQRLGWSPGSLRGRLERGRKRLHERLTRRGLSLAAVLGAAELSRGPAAGMPALLSSTVKAALLFAAGQATDAGLIGPGAVALAERMVRAMWMTKLKLATAVLATALLAGVVAYQTVAARAPGDEPGAVAANTRPANVENAVENEAIGDTISVKATPPVVVQTVPKAGDPKVDASKVKEIRVTFSKDMMDKSWSWSQLSNDTVPKVTGKPHYAKDKRTCVLPVKLEAGKTYAFWLNSEKFGNFKDADGRSAVPYLLVFETKP
jgi:RNA polymerase sigma-70 factor (ECF subfamily)